MTTTSGLEATEAECAMGRNAPRVSLADIQANIAEEYYLLGMQAASLCGLTSNYASLDSLTICLLVLGNGFTIIGKSAPASIENFDPMLGRKLAYEDAVRQVWPLMGYALRDKLQAMPSAIIPPAHDMRQYVGSKAINAKPMTRQAYNDLRGWTLPHGENGSDAGYLVEYADGQRPNIDGYDGYVSWSPADVFEASYRPRHG